MTIVSVSAASRSDLRRLGNNVWPQARRAALQIQAVNRTLEIFDEQIDRLYRRAASPRRPHLRRGYCAA